MSRQICGRGIALEFVVIAGDFVNLILYSAQFCFYIGRASKNVPESLTIDHVLSAHDGGKDIPPDVVNSWSFKLLRNVLVQVWIWLDVCMLF